MALTLSDIKVFAFDLDDTLYDESLFVQKGTLAVLKWLVDRYNLDLQSLKGRMNSISKTYSRNEWYQKLLEETDIPLSHGLIEEMVEIYRTHPPNLHLFPDAATFLTRIKRKEGVFLGIITDGNVAVQESKVKGLGLDRIMDLSVFTWSKGAQFQKPHNWSFRLVEEHAKARGVDCCYFGNDPNKDFLAPNQLGWKTVCINRGNSHKIKYPSQEYATHVEINSFDAISVA